MADKVTWFEMPADDTSRAAEFYRNVFEWKTPDMGMGDGSLMAETSPSGDDMQPLEKGSINGSIAPRSESFDKPHIVVTVDDLDAKLETVRRFGGTVIQPRQDVGGMMSFAIISDTEGNAIGIIENL